MTSKVARAERNGTAERTVIERAARVAGDVSAQARTTAADTTAIVVDRAPTAVATSRGIVERVLMAVRGSSTSSLELGTVFAAGMSGGMLLSRAPRPLVALAFLPTLLLGGTLLGRGTTDGGKPSHGART
jgi:hypothetical protein